MHQYQCTVQANTHNTANTDDTFIEITAPSNRYIKIKGVRVEFQFGTATATSDAHFRVKLVTKSVAGTGGVSGTVTQRDPSAPSSLSTVLVKSGTTDFTVGTVIDTLELASIHVTNEYVWNAFDESEKIIILPAGIFGIFVTWPSATQQNFTVTLWWEE